MRRYFAPLALPQEAPRHEKQYWNTKSGIFGAFLQDLENVCSHAVIGYALRNLKIFLILRNNPQK